MAFERVTAVERLWSGEMHAHVVSGVKVLLVRLDDGVHAFENRCAHLGLPLDGGTLAGNVLTCRYHHYEYDARSGRGVNPRGVCLRAFSVKVIGPDIWVDVTGAGGGPP